MSRLSRNKHQDQSYITRFRYAKPKVDASNTDSFKEIRIYADNGPVHTSDGHMVEFNWYNHKNEYEEDIFTLLNLNKLTHVHAYVMASFRKWSPHFAQEVLAQTSIESDFTLSQRERYSQREEIF